MNSNYTKIYVFTREKDAYRYCKDVCCTTRYLMVNMCFIDQQKTINNCIGGN